MIKKKSIYKIILCLSLFLLFYSCTPAPPEIDPQEKAAAQKLLDRGVNALSNGDYKQTIQLWCQAQEIFKTAKHDLGVATCRGSISKIYLYIGQFDKAEHEAELAVPVMEKYGFKKKMTRYMLVRAEALLRMRRLEESKNIYEEAGEQAREIKLKALEAQAVLGIAVNEKESGNYYASMYSLEKAKILAEEGGWTGGIYNVFLNYAEVHRQLGNYFRTLEYIDLASEIVTRMGGKGQAVDWEDVEIVRGSTLWILRDFKNARFVLETVYASLKKKKTDRENRLIEVLGNLGNIYCDLNKWEDALDCYEQAMVLAEKIHYQIAIDRLNGLIGDLYLKKGNYNKAKIYYKKSGNQIKLCRLMLKTDQTYKALNMIQTLINKEKKIGRIGILFNLYSLEMECYEKSGLLENALLSAYKSLGMFQALRSRLEDPYRLTFASKAQSPVTHFVNLSLKLHNQGKTPAKNMGLGANYMEMAFSISEYLKSRLLLDVMANSFSGRSTQPKVAQNLLSREQEVIDMENNLKKISHNPKKQLQYPILRNKYMKAKKTLVDDLYKKAPLYAMSHYPQPLKYQDIILEPEEAVLSYFYDGNQLVLFLLQYNQQLKVFPIKLSGETLTELINKYRMNIQIQIGGFTEPFDKKLSASLYDLLIKPVEPYLEEKSILTIIPDGPLNDIPFESFMISDTVSNSNFLIDRYTVRYFPSASVMTFLRKVKKTINQTREIKVFAMADPVFSIKDQRYDEKLSGEEKSSESATRTLRRLADEPEKGEFKVIRLKETRIEVEEISKTVGKKRVLSYFDLPAQEAVIKGMPLDSFSILHFATHGILSNQISHIPEPALVLSLVDTGKEDGFLTLSEVTNLNLNADVVILSACNTGRGEFVLGEGTKSLAWGFMQAGAHSLVVSLWSVDSETAKDCMVEFYKQLDSGRGNAQALRNARLKIKKTHSHPAYWAPFILQGG